MLRIGWRDQAALVAARGPALLRVHDVVRGGDVPCVQVQEVRLSTWPPVCLRRRSWSSWSRVSRNLVSISIVDSSRILFRRHEGRGGGFVEMGRAQTVTLFSRTMKRHTNGSWCRRGGMPPLATLYGMPPSSKRMTPGLICATLILDRSLAVAHAGFGGLLW